MSVEKTSESGYLEMSGMVKKPPDSIYLDMSGLANSELPRIESIHSEIPMCSGREPETKVWIERVRQRRPMSEREVAENFEFFDALEQKDVQKNCVG